MESSPHLIQRHNTIGIMNQQQQQQQKHLPLLNSLETECHNLAVLETAATITIIYVVKPISLEVVMAHYTALYPKV